MGLFDSIGDFFSKAQAFGEQVQGGLDVLVDIKERVQSFSDFGTPTTPAFNPGTFSLPLPNYMPTVGGALTAPPPASRAPSGTVILAGMALLAFVVFKR